MQDEPLVQSLLPLAEGFAGTGLAGDGEPPCSAQPPQHWEVGQGVNWGMQRDLCLSQVSGQSKNDICGFRDGGSISSFK